MKKIEIELKELFRNPAYLDSFFSQLGNKELYTLIECGFIYILTHNLNGKGIELNKPDEIKQALHKIWKKVEKDILFGYNICRK